eukprot:m.129511 g.129511  ORF g.129511 m.129511 type:complete len:779 (-) comp14578_c0_seq4:15-2351(-)
MEDHGFGAAAPLMKNNNGYRADPGGAVIGLDVLNMGASSMPRPLKPQQDDQVEDDTSSKKSAVDAVLVSVQGSGLYLQTLEDQRTIANMSIPPSREFACAAVVHPISQHIYCCFKSPLEVKVWKTVGEKFARGTTMALKGDNKEVHALHACVDLPGVFIVFTDGSVTYYDATSLTPLSTKEKKGASEKPVNVCWSGIAQDYKRKLVRILTLVSVPGETNGELLLCCRSVNCASSLGAKLPVQKMVLKSHGAAGGVAHACFQFPKHFHVLYKNGAFVQFDIGKAGDRVCYNDDTQKDAIPELECEKSFGQLGGLIQTEISDDSNRKKSKSKRKRDDNATPTCSIVLEHFNTTHVALMCTLKSSDDALVVLWDTIHGAVKATHTISASVNAKRKHGIGVQVDHTLLKAGPSTLIAANHGNSVWALSLNDSTAVGTLAGVLGSMKITRQLLTPEAGSAVSDPKAAYAWGKPKLSQDGTYDSWMEDEQKKEAKLDALANELITEKFDSEDEYDKALQAYLTACHHRDLKITRKLQTPIKTRHQTGLSPHMISQIAKHCLKEERYSLISSLVRLVRLNCVSYRDVPDIMETACKLGNEPLLYACVLHLNTLPEEVLVKCIIRIYDQGKGKDSSSDKGKETPFYALLRHVVSSKWNELDIVEHLRKASVDVALEILQFCEQWLDQLGECGSSDTLSKEYKGPVPSYEQLLEWMCHVLDSHFSVFVLTEESHPVILKAKSRLQSHLELTKKLQENMGLLSNFILKKPLPRRHADIGLYTIEHIDF